MSCGEKEGGLGEMRLSGQNVKHAGGNKSIPPAAPAVHIAVTALAFPALALSTLNWIVLLLVI